MENEKTIKKDATKEKIILFIIGVLVGAVISTGAFFAYIKLAGLGTNCSSQSMQMPGGTPPEMPSGSQSGTPPEKPSDDNQSTTPSEKPTNENSSDNTDNQTNSSSSNSNQNTKSQN